MDFIISFIKSMSVISVVLAAVWLLIPKGSAQLSFKYVIGIFTVAALISAFNGSGELSFDFSNKKNHISEVDISAQIETETLTIVIEELLKSEGIEFKKIEIITDNFEDDSINITKVKVWLVYEDDFEKAKTKILKETGLELVGG